jgi:leucyl-tRNA synthetase
MNEYNHKKIEEKWQKYWRDHDTYRTPDLPKDPHYVLDMFPYPSGSGLHVGHVEGYVGTDVYARFLRMQGKDVLHPMGWDAFGLPAENYAVKTGTHPRETTTRAIAAYKEQLNRLGFSYDWQREINTSRPKYYGWTQWLFGELYENGLATKKPAEVNWCPSCQTVLANEQVVDGACERCDSKVVQKEMEQWFFSITDYADELIDGLEELDWPPATKAAQRNWVGRAEGARFSFPVSGKKQDYADLEVFTTRADTLYGVTFMVVAPEHDLVGKALDDGRLENADKVSEYIKKTEAKTERERQESDEKTGVKLAGVTATHPATGEKIPIFVADYVLAGYGTGAIMAVPAHDKRDFAFAYKIGIELLIKSVVIPSIEKLLDFSGDFEGGIENAVGENENIESSSKRYAKKAQEYIEKGERWWIGSGKLVNSGEFSGLSSAEAAEKITEKFGQAETTYRLRDWSVGRQRFWGCPIPVVYDPEGKAHLVPEKHLPWKLPDDVPFEPTGEAPLAASRELKERTEEIFGAGWTPETSTLDTFVDSSWYYLRFTDPQNTDEFASSEAIKRWCPVDTYVGGAEHSVMHLLYARFITKVLADLGHINFREPFTKLRHQGLIMAEDGTKMSKSKGNVVNPDTVVETVGADTLRLYELFAGPFGETVEWDTDSIAGPRRFLERVWRLAQAQPHNGSNLETVPEDQALHATIKAVTDDLSDFRFNTAISHLMELLNNFQDRETVSAGLLSTFVRLLAPLAPHISEELWQALGGEPSVHQADWPRHDAAVAAETEITIAIQIDGKLRGEVKVSQTADETAIISQAKAAEGVTALLENKTIKRHIYVPNRLVNFVTTE